MTHFFSKDISNIGKSAWDAMREGMTCESAGTIGDLKQELEELCSKVACEEAPNPEFLSSQVSISDVRDAVKSLKDSYEQFLNRIPVKKK